MQHDQRQEGGDEEHHRHGERQAVATPVYPEEDASHRQQAEAGEPQRRSIRTVPIRSRSASAAPQGQHDQHPAETVDLLR